MKQQILIKKKVLIAIICALMSMYCSAVHAKEAFSPGSNLPMFNLEVLDSSDSAYLRTKDTKNISLSQIPAKLIVVEFFSVFCPVCQVNAPFLNRLYHVIRNDQTLDKDIKVIGIVFVGKTNEIVMFKEKFKVEYPLFEDSRGEIQSRTKVNYVPLTLVIDKNGKIIMSHPGMLKDLDTFLIELRKNHKAL
jgi:peroxiredoxin